MVLQGDVGAHDQVADGPGGQDVAGLGGRQHPSRDVDRDAADVAVSKLDLAGVQPGSDLDADAAQLVSERGRAADAPSGAVEGGQDAITGADSPGRWDEGTEAIVASRAG